MRKIAVLDCETDPFKKGRVPKPFIWGFYDGVTYTEYDNVNYFIEDIQDQELIVYAHNGGKFDFHFMLEHLEPFDDDLFIINGRLTKFKIGICEFRDSFSILPVALKAFEKMEFKYSLLEKSQRDKPENKLLISEYLQSDCVNLYNMVTAFVGKYGCHLTQASAAVKTWSKMAKVKPPRSTRDYYQQFSPFYYGGRVQCFQRGIIYTDFSVIDINSAYPYAMCSKHPFSIEYFHNEGKPKTVKGHQFLTVKAVSHGALPFRDTNKALIFPDDDIERIYHITGWELIAGLETKTVTVNEYIDYYEHLELIDFTEYIYHFYDLRREAKAAGNKEDDLFSKLLMNSLYGKFGSNPDKYNKYMILPADKVDYLGTIEMKAKHYKKCDICGKIHRPGAMIIMAGNGKVYCNHACYEQCNDKYEYSGDLGPWVLAQKDLADEEKRYYNVCTSASITGYVRAYLWKAICAVGKENMLYCDTDSIAASNVIERPGMLEIGEELGKWKFEGDFIKAGIAGKKLYIFKGKSEPGKKTLIKTASKGARLTNKQLWQIAGGKSVLFKPKNPVFSLKKKPSFVNRVIQSTGG